MRDHSVKAMGGHILKTEILLKPTVCPPSRFLYVLSYQSLPASARCGEAVRKEAKKMTAVWPARHKDLVSNGIVFLTSATTGLSLLAVWWVIGATPWGPQRTPAVTRLHVRDATA